MKKMLFFATMLCFVMLGTTNAQTKYEIKEAKKQAKRMIKDGWKSESHKSIEVLFLEFYSLEKEYEIYVGRADDYGFVGVAKNAARLDALRECIEVANTYFKGVGDQLQGKLDSKTIDNLTMAASSEFEGKIADGFQVKFSLSKSQNGSISVQSYCYINRQKVEEAKKSAIQAAAEQAGIEAIAVGNYSKEIQNIINSHDLQ